MSQMTCIYYYLFMITYIKYVDRIDKMLGDDVIIYRYTVNRLIGKRDVLS